MNIGYQGTFSAPTFYQVDDNRKMVGSTVTACTQSTDFCDIVQATIKGPGLVASDAMLQSVNRFAYPGGGEPTLNYPPRTLCQSAQRSVRTRAARVLPNLDAHSLS